VKTKNLFLVITVLALAALACSLLIPHTPTPEPPPSPDPYDPTPEPPLLSDPTGSAPSEPDSVDMVAKLVELGGQPCEEKPEFTCVSIQVPLDHFDSTNTETLNMVFSVSPAYGERYGMFVLAYPGGPGGEGVSTASLFWFSEEILEHYDIVYFDQRGVGLSHPIACPMACEKDFLNYLTETDQEGLEGYDTSAEQQAAIENARTFVDECVAEIGPDAARLEFFGTNQVAEDLEIFRQMIGDEQFMLYGVSYGTAVAQTYTAAHPERLMGLVIDGTSDLTLTGEADAFSQERGFDEVLVATLKACDADEYCAAKLGGNALAFYDDLAKRVSENPIPYEFPLPSGEKVSRTFTFNQLEYTTAYQMYSFSGRMLFLRALSAAKDRDLVPMTRLLYERAELDPETFNYLGDPNFSDTMYYGVHCTDYSYFSGTTDERINQIIQAGQASNGTVPRLDGNIYTGLTCAQWPSAPDVLVKTEPLIAEGVPTFVLNATLDPATPFWEGETVFENLADGYHLYVNGGRHSIYGYKYDCPDDYITDFMVDGILPDQREIVCEEWDEQVIRDYKPRIMKNASDYSDVLEIFWAIDDEIEFQPEYYYGDFKEDVSVACPYGGSFTFGPSDLGEDFIFENCSHTRGFSLTGTGSYDYDERVFIIVADVSGDKSGSLTYTRNYDEGSGSVVGEYGGETIDLQR